jgi:2-dehydro-3-deoxyphosphogluconate aldolase/(4S)-4-hydroxy-2-oxoglutarate aldolase
MDHARLRRLAVDSQWKGNPVTGFEGAEASNRYFDDAFAAQRVMAILRGYSPEATVELCERAWDAGILVIEIPIQSKDAVPSLQAAVAAGRLRGRAVGAGTVTTLDQLEVVRSVGAAFTVSPGFDPEVAEASVDAGLPHLCGVATSSEIQAAVRAGLSWLKAFPAAELGASWFTAQHAPFPAVRFVATGGIGPWNAQEFFDSGARVAAIGSAFADPTAIPHIARLSLRPGAH